MPATTHANDAFVAVLHGACATVAKSAPAIITHRLRLTELDELQAAVESARASLIRLSADIDLTRADFASREPIHSVSTK